jgi:hypothetical protein
MTAREQVAPRGVRDPCEGKALKGRNPTDGCGMRQGREADAGREAAERLRKPGGGTEAGCDALASQGAGSGDAVEGTKKLGGVGSDREVGRPGGGERSGRDRRQGRMSLP